MNSVIQIQAIQKSLTLEIIMFLLIILLNTQANAEDNWHNKVSVLLGQKHLDKDYFEDNSHSAFGLSFDIQKKNWPVSVAIDLIGAGKEQTVNHQKIEKVTGGLHLGIRKYWLLNDNIEPYLGGGMNLAVVERKKIINDVIEKQDDDDIGYWLATGINWRIDNHFIIGAEIRYSDAEVTLFDSTINTGGIYSMLSFGYQF